MPPLSKFNDDPPETPATKAEVSALFLNSSVFVTHTLSTKGFTASGSREEA